MKEEKIRSKYYTIELYDESENINFNDKIEIIKKYNYAYIKHDKDGVKEHYHVVMAFPNYRYKTSLCEELGIPPNYIEPVRSIEGMLTYLIHLNDKQKYQYKLEDVIGSSKLLNQFKKCIKNNDLVEEEKIIELLDYIDRSEYITFKRFIRYACSIGRFDIVRRSQYIFIRLLEEHNTKVLEVIDDIKLSWYNDYNDRS